MKRIIPRLFGIEIKKYLRALPYALLATVVLFAFIGLFIMGAYKSTQSDDAGQMDTKQVAIVCSDSDNYYISYALDLLSSMESLEGRLSFLEMDYNTAMDNLTKRKIMAIIYLPEGAIDQIMYLGDVQVEVIFPGDKDLSAIFLTEFTKAGGRLLTTAQAGSLTAAEIFKMCNTPMGKTYDTIDAMNFSFVLPRLGVFTEPEEGNTGVINYLSFYLSSGILLLLLFIGFGLMPALKLDSSQIARIKMMKGVHPLVTYFIRVCVLTLVMFLFSFGVLFAGTRIYPLLSAEEITYHFSTSSLLFLLTLSLFLAVYNQMLLYATGEAEKATLLLFSVGAIMSFASGNILPLSFFPAAVRTYGKWIPCYELQQNITALLSGKNTFMFKTTLLWIVVFLAAGILFVWKQKRRDVQ